MRKIIAITILFHLTIQNSYCQTPGIEWEKSFGGSLDDGFYDICFNDSTIVMVGYTESSNSIITNNHGSKDVWLVKINEQGNLLSNNCFGGAAVEYGYSINSTKDKGFIIACDADYTNGQVPQNHGVRGDYWIIKTDSSTNLEWSHCYGGSETDRSACIIETLDSGYFVVGKTHSWDYDVTNYHGAEDMWILKLNHDSTIAWSATFGGTHYDFTDPGNACFQGLDSCFYVVGNVFSNDGTVSGNHGSTDMYVIKLSASGQTIWQKCYGGTGLDNGFAIAPDGDGFLYVAGNTSSIDGDVSINHGSDDFWLLKLDTAGNIIWEKTFGGSYSERLFSMCASSDGGAILTGIAFGNDGMVTGVHGLQDFWVVKSDSSGNLVWSKALGGTDTDIPHTVKELSNGSVIVAGFTKSNDGDVTNHLGGEDAWVVKLSPPGLGIPENLNDLKNLSIFQKDNSINVSFLSRHMGKATMTLYNLAGQKISEKTISLNEGINYHSISAVGNGMYFLSITGSNATLGGEVFLTNK